MKSDTYTKVILTIIAICLTINIIQEWEIIPAATASSTLEAPKYKLIPLDDSNTIDVRIVDINTYDELNVNLKSVDTYDEVKVNLKSIDTNDELDVNIDELGGTWVNPGGPLRVKLD